MDTTKAIMIATDGSQASKVAFYQSVEFFEFQNLFDMIVVSHVADPAKTYLPFEYQGSTIFEDYKVELLSRYPEAKYKLCFEDRSQDEENIRSQMLKIAEKFNTSYLFVGFHGRKGIKQDATVLGQTLRNSVYNSKVPLFIVKQLYKRDETNGFKFVVCVDGSKKSLQALDAGIQLSFDQRDQLIIVFAPSPDSVDFGEAVKSKVDDHMASIQRNWEFRSLQPNYRTTDELLGLINNSDDLDFIVLGANGYRAQLELKQFIGSTSDELLRKAKANIIVVP